MRWFLLLTLSTSALAQQAPAPKITLADLETLIAKKPTADPTPPR